MDLSRENEICDHYRCIVHLRMNNLQLLKDMLFERDECIDEITHRLNVIGEKCDKMKAIYGIMDKEK